MTDDRRHQSTGIGLCRFCGRRQPMTRDHIIPRAWGGSDRLWHPDGPQNIRMICQDCNHLRGQVGHCVGAMAALRALPLGLRMRTLPTLATLAGKIARPRWLWWEVSRG